MATGFIPAIIAILLGFACGAARAGEIALIGVIGDRAAVLALDGGEPKTVKVGQAWNGIRVLSVERDRAAIELDGRRRLLVLGPHHRAAEVLTGRAETTLAADERGHFIGDGAINGQAVRFIIDTGATAVALPARDAQRLGLDYRKGAQALAKTPAGTVPVFRVNLDSVKLGSIELRSVEGVVIEQGLDVALLGMTFLSRVEMKREGENMVLTRRF